MKIKSVRISTPTGEITEYEIGVDRCIDIEHISDHSVAVTESGYEVKYRKVFCGMPFLVIYEEK